MSRRLLLVVALAAVTTLLGSNAVPSSAEGVLATPVRIVGGRGHAGLYGWGAATTSDGSVLIGDYWNFRVQQFERDGTLRRTAVPKDGKHQAPFDVAVDLRDDSVYVSDTDGGRNIDKYDKNGVYLSSFGSQTVFKYPSWLEVDSLGRVAVGDSTGNRITVFNDQGQQLFQYGSKGSAPGQFKDPRGIGIDADDNLYVADLGNQRIQVFAFGPSGLTFLRQWSAIGGDFRGLTVDKANGWVYLVNSGKSLIQKWDLFGNPLGSWGGFGTGPGVFLDGGRGVTVDGDSNVWVGDMPNFRAQKFSPTGEFLLQAPTPAQPPPPGGFAFPSSQALDADGNIYVVDSYNFRVQKFEPSGAFALAWGRRGSGTVKNGFQYPRGIAVDKADGTVVVADTDNSWIKKYNGSGVHLWGVPGVKSFALDVAADGTIYAADFKSNVVKVISSTGTVQGSFGSGQLSNPRGIAVDDDGSIWVANRGSGKISHFTSTGTLLASFGAAGTGDSLFAQASDVETYGQHVFVADQSANKVKVWTKGGTFVGAFGGAGGALGRMIAPIGLDMTPQGRLYVTEFGGERVQEFTVHRS